MLNFFTLAKNSTCTIICTCVLWWFIVPVYDFTVNLMISWVWLWQMKVSQDIEQTVSQNERRLTCASQNKC